MTISAIQSAATGTTNSRDGTTLAADFDTFLQLLTTQLQTQDPLSPMDAEQFTSQLVQFAGVEQAIRTNTQLESLVSLMQLNQHTAALQYVGATVELDNSRVHLPRGGEASIAYTLDGPAAAVGIEIVDADGSVVRRIAGPTGEGPQELAWDGVDEDRRGRQPGTYEVRIEAVDAAGRPVPVTQTSTGTVEALVQSEEGLVLSIDGRSFPLDAVRAIRHAP
jgi:flagellar basal-body rod modification protein FlgD